MDKIQEDSEQNALIILHLRQQCDAQQRDQKRLLEQIATLTEALRDAETNLTSVCESGDFAMPDDTSRQLVGVRDDILEALVAVHGNKK